MSDFINFRNAVQKNFAKLSKGGTLYISSVSKDDVWDTYLSSFPEGTNPLFRERTEHDCQCCKQFVRYVGRVLGQVDGEVKSVWDFEYDGYYGEVAQALANINRESGISGLFLHNEREIGRDHSFEQREDGTEIRWDHFHQVVPQSAYCPSGIGEKKGAAQTNHKVLKRSITELSESAVEVVAELIDQSAIYRGEEHKGTVNLIQKLQREYKKAEDKDLYVWNKAVELKGVSALRNTVIGTLIVDISEGTDLEDAVKKFESKVAPHNYKRSSSLVTPRMKEEAQKKAKELGIEPSLLRRYATKEDVSVNNVLFADNTVKPFMEDSVFDVLTPTKQTDWNKALKNVQEMSVDKFIKDVLPKAESIELLLENKHESNLMSLIAPVHGTAPNIMKWNNNFSWTYNGDITDSDIRTRVKGAGGVVDAPLRISLAWNNRDDLDLHINSTSGKHTYYGSMSTGDGGRLDVDMRGEKFNQVENIYWQNLNTLNTGREIPIWVHNYSKNVNGYSDPVREEGFVVEVEILGEIHTITYNKPVRGSGNVQVGKVLVKKDGTFEVVTEQCCESSSKSKEVWNLVTKDFHKVDMVMNSPNHWDEQQIGNKHLFFVLEGCRNETDARGFYNEYLIQELKPHRKVFEVLASKLKAPYNEEQLSGVGFSSTQPNEVTLRVKGSFNRVIKVLFNK
ncbi:coil containing protein [Vibrio phage 1.101.O._10N.261.45.C6]|nr:coil containing protein [Vibrio phage 1.101.O._10N.261.45.C6]